MKKILSIMMAFVMVLCYSCSVLAVDEYGFDLQYSGTIVKNIEKNASVVLMGVNATLHTNVQIKVNITGPATPTLLATDTLGIEHDIAQIGYWGPVDGFPVQGNFTNTTPVKATFPEEGSYTITLSLVDLANANNIITSKTFNLEVYEDEAPIVNTVNNTMVEELPKTGTSLWEYVIYIGVLTTILAIVGIYLNKNRKIEI